MTADSVYHDTCLECGYEFAFSDLLHRESAEQKAIWDEYVLHNPLPELSDEYAPIVANQCSMCGRPLREKHG